MIFDNLRNAEHYRGIEPLYRALKWLEEREVPLEGHIELDGDNLFANPCSFTTLHPSECVYEAHRNYADIHFILEGTERIEVRDVRDLTPEIPYDPDRDIAFFTGEAKAQLKLEAGDFLVCWPEDAHRVGMMGDAPEAIKKIVVKIKV